MITLIFAQNAINSKMTNQLTILLVIRLKETGCIPIQPVSLMARNGDCDSGNYLW